MMGAEATAGPSTVNGSGAGRNAASGGWDGMGWYLRDDELVRQHDACGKALHERDQPSGRNEFEERNVLQ